MFQRLGQACNMAGSLFSHATLHLWWFH